MLTWFIIVSGIHCIKGILYSIYQNGDNGEIIGITRLL